MEKIYVQAYLTEEKKEKFYFNLLKNKKKASPFLNEFIDKFNKNPKKVIKFIESET